MNEHTYWQWLIRGFDGLVNMMGALMRANVPASEHARLELIKVRDKMNDAIAYLEQHQI